MVDKHLLVVEDDANARALPEQFLARRGWRVRAVGDGLSALDSFKKAPSDLVITDYKMPRLDGLKLAQRLLGETPDLPIIMMTAHADAGVQAALADGQLTALIEKPVNLREIAGAIDAVLNATSCGCDAKRGHGHE